MNKPMDENAAVHALAAILKENPDWHPHEGDELTISCGTAYVLAPDVLKFRLTKPVIEAALLISGVHTCKSSCVKCGI